MMNAIKYVLLSGFSFVVLTVSPGVGIGAGQLLLNMLDDAPKPLEPVRTRSQPDRDRLHAGALYATARTLAQRGEVEAALQHFQRAWRWDPAASFMLSDIVALAFSLNRPEEAVRYAQLAAQTEDTDALLLRRLALYVTERGDWSQAVQLYRQWIAHPDIRISRNQLSKLLVQLEIGRLEYLVDNAPAASKALGEFQAAVIQVDETSSLGKNIRRALGDDLNATWELCGLAHLDAGAFELASQALDQIDLPLNESGRLGYLQARAAVGRGEPLVAWQHLRDFFRAGYVEHGDQPYLLLEQILTQLHQGDSLLLELVKLHKDDPDNPALAFALANQMQRQQQIPQAIDLYRSIVTAAQRSSDEIQIRATGRLIKLYADRGQAHELLQLLKLVAGQLDAVSRSDELFSAISQHPELIDRLVELAMEIDVNSLARSQALIMATLMQSAEKHHEAERFYQRAIAIDPQDAPEIALGWGLELLIAEQYAAAVEVLEKGIKSRPAEGIDGTLEFYLAMALELDGNTEEAIAVALRGAALQPESAEMAGRLPWILYHAKRYEDAKEAYGRFLDRFDSSRDPTTRDALREARFVLSNLDVLSDNMSAGEEWLEQVLDEFPQDVGAMNDLGYLWADQNKHLHRAKRFVEQAVADKPESAAYRDSLGWVLFHLGEYDGALVELETAVRLSRTAASDNSEVGEADGIILDHLGDVQLALGHVDQAIASWQRALPGLNETEPEKAVATRGKIEEHQSLVHE